MSKDRLTRYDLWVTDAAVRDAVLDVLAYAEREARARVQELVGPNRPIRVSKVLTDDPTYDPLRDRERPPPIWRVRAEAPPLAAPVPEEDPQ